MILSIVFLAATSQKKFYSSFTSKYKIKVMLINYLIEIAISIFNRNIGQGT